MRRCAPLTFAALKMGKVCLPGRLVKSSGLRSERNDTVLKIQELFKKLLAMRPFLQQTLSSLTIE